MADLPDPIPGLVIRYSYLWHQEYARGRTIGSKDRPCVVVLAVTHETNGEVTVAVAPITHAVPKNPGGMVKLTAATQRRLKLDADQCWIVATEVNEFKWPGPDVVAISDGEYAYGELPEVVFLDLKKKLLLASTSRVPRTE